MKIEKLILKNFSAVYNAMNAKSLVIDFSKSKNKICLLLAKNGGGKTTILSQLTPFADVGNLDVRNNQPLILKNEEGYKEIHIRKDNNLYIIKHIYTPHKDKSHSTKSYIEKNGTELNINGNVRSFLETVKNELNIEPEYLKLIRLGSNVTSIIGLTETERKNFMSKIMSDVDVYIDYYKIVGAKEKQIKDNISHTANKLSKLGISDILIADKEIKHIEEEIVALDDIKIDLNKDIAVYNHNIDMIDDNENLRDNLNETSKKLTKMKDTLLRYKPDNTSADYYKEEIGRCNDKITSLSAMINSTGDIINSELVLINTLHDQYENVNSQYEKELSNDKTIKQMEDNLNTIRKSLRESESIIGDYKPKFTLDEFNDFVSFIKSIQVKLSTTYEFGTKAISKVLKLMEDNEDVKHYINSHLIDIDDKKSDVSSLFLAKIATSIMFNDTTVINCKSECEAKKVFNMVKDLISDHNIKDTNKDASFYNDMDRVYQNITNILSDIDSRSIMISKMPDDIKSWFSKDILFHNIKNLEKFYDEIRLNEMITIVSEYDRYCKNLVKYDESENLLNQIKSISNLDSIKEQRNNLSDSITEKECYIRDLKEKVSKATEDLNETKRTLDTYNDIFDAITKYDEIKLLNDKYVKDYEVYKTSSENIANLNTRLKNVISELDNKNDKLRNMKYNYDQYNMLLKELELFNKIYDDLDKVKESLSAKSGIPLYIIRRYLGDTVEATNELLSVVYNGDIELDDFEITPSSFSIPVYVKGFKMPDVKYTSQGELSFISIALSFALSSRVLSKYNIMLLDEIDGPLDTENREKFIKILEKQIDKIDSEQNFLITHNSMFSSYPVDILDLSFSDRSDDYPLANFIDIIRE